MAKSKNTLLEMIILRSKLRRPFKSLRSRKCAQVE